MYNLPFFSVATGGTLSSNETRTSASAGARRQHGRDGDYGNNGTGAAAQDLSHGSPTLLSDMSRLEETLVAMAAILARCWLARHDKDAMPVDAASAERHPMHVTRAPAGVVLFVEYDDLLQVCDSGALLCCWGAVVLCDSCAMMCCCHRHVVCWQPRRARSLLSVSVVCFSRHPHTHSPTSNSRLFYPHPNFTDTPLACNCSMC